MSSTEETSQLKAGHPPAVFKDKDNRQLLTTEQKQAAGQVEWLLKAGGMRITQHKVSHPKDVKESTTEDLTGLSGPSPVPSNPVSISGAPNRGNADFTPEAAQVAHSPKPPAHINIKPNPNIQQPRK